MQRYNSNSLRVLFDTLLPDTISLHIVVGEIPFIKDRHVVDSITFVKKHLKGFN